MLVTDRPVPRSRAQSRANVLPPSNPSRRGDLPPIPANIAAAPATTQAHSPFAVRRPSVNRSRTPPFRIDSRLSPSAHAKPKRFAYTRPVVTKNPHAVELGRQGGRARTPQKTAAARRNGRKGGRPPQRHPDRPASITPPPDDTTSTPSAPPRRP